MQMKRKKSQQSILRLGAYLEYCLVFDKFQPCLVFWLFIKQICKILIFFTKSYSHPSESQQYRAPVSIMLQ